MYFFVIQAAPLEGSCVEEDFRGAYVSCWVDFALREGAEVLARHYIREQGWAPGRIDEMRWVERTDYARDPENVVYFDEAKQEGASFVIHMWSTEEHEEEEVELVH